MSKAQRFCWFHPRHFLTTVIFVMVHLSSNDPLPLNMHSKAKMPCYYCALTFFLISILDQFKQDYANHNLFLPVCGRPEEIIFVKGKCRCKYLFEQTRCLCQVRLILQDLNIVRLYFTLIQLFINTPQPLGHNTDSLWPAAIFSFAKAWWPSNVTVCEHRQRWVYLHVAPPSLPHTMCIKDKFFVFLVTSIFVFLSVPVRVKMTLKMKLAVFACLLVILPLQAVSGSCVGKTVDVWVINGHDLTGDGLARPDPYVKVSYLKISLKS